MGTAQTKNTYSTRHILVTGSNTTEIYRFCNKLYLSFAHNLMLEKNESNFHCVHIYNSLKNIQISNETLPKDIIDIIIDYYQSLLLITDTFVTFTIKHKINTPNVINSINNINIPYRYLFVNLNDWDKINYDKYKLNLRSKLLNEQKTQSFIWIFSLTDYNWIINNENKLMSSIEHCRRLANKWAKNTVFQIIFTNLSKFKETMIKYPFEKYFPRFKAISSKFENSTSSISKNGYIQDIMEYLCFCLLSQRVNDMKPLTRVFGSDKRFMRWKSSFDRNKPAVIYAIDGYNNQIFAKLIETMCNDFESLSQYHHGGSICSCYSFV